MLIKRYRLNDVKVRVDKLKAKVIHRNICWRISKFNHVDDISTMLFLFRIKIYDCGQRERDRGGGGKESDGLNYLRSVRTQNSAIWTTAYHLHTSTVIMTRCDEFLAPVDFLALQIRWEEKISVSNRGKLANAEKTIGYDNMLIYNSF